MTSTQPVHPVHAAPGFVIDWRTPAGRPDWLMGTGATPPERAIVWIATAAGLAAVVWAGPDRWTWWQWALVVALAADLVGGVAANALSTAKRQYHGGAPEARVVVRALRSSPLFTAAHVHPFLVAALMPGAGWRWATFWYVGCLVSVVVVGLVPLHLQRPAASGAVAVLLAAGPLVAAPAGLAWFGPVLAVKLVATHAVREEPYRPGPSPQDAR